MSQSRGLIAALQKKQSCDVHEISITNLPSVATQLIYCLIRKRLPQFPAGTPDIMLGVGHATHLPVLVASSLLATKSLVLMRPSLPHRWFDLVVVPHHDKVRQAPNVVHTHGVINNITNTNAHKKGAGLILVGGTSAHYHWNDSQLVKQIGDIIDSSNSVVWLLTTSRRTPATFLAALNESINSDRLIVIPYEVTDSQWMQDEMARASMIWVTPDSVSMVYESLTSGASVGTFELEGGRGRIATGVNDLVEKGLVTSFQQWLKHGELNNVHFASFNEADRIASIIVERWFGA